MPDQKATRTQPDRTQPDDAPKPWHTEGLKEPEPKDDKPQRPKIPWLRLLSFALLGYLITFVIMSFQDASTAPKVISYTQFTQDVAAKSIQKIYENQGSIQGELKDGTQFSTVRPSIARDDPIAQLVADGVEVKAEPLVQQRGIWGNLLTSFLPILLLLGGYAWLMSRQMKGGVGGMMGKKFTPLDESAKRVTFADVAGIDEVEEQVSEVVDFLRNPEKYRRLGARAPKGVLLSGGPGTGKTLLARATAGEASVPFFSASASEFIEMIVGVGAQRVRQLFEEARKAAPAIIFIDEIDTIGRARGGSRAMGGNDEREQTLNQILTEMDGFDGTEGVVVMAATNRADVLDPALTRPGRFDREITVHAPDRTGRVQILGVHTRTVPLDADVSLEEIAKATPGMTGADLANLVNEAAIIAAKRMADAVAQADFFNALEKVQLGVARHVVMPPEERRLTAYHEAGHALLGMLQKGADPVRKISIIPRGRALGVTLSTPDDDKYGYDRDYLRGRIIGALGGLAAESIVFGKTTTGVDNDLEQATGIARAMVGRWGMSPKIGPVSVLSNEGDPRMMGVADATLAEVDAEARRVITECEAEAKRLLTEHRAQLDSIVAALLEQETLDEADAYAAAGIPRPVHEVPELLGAAETASEVDAVGVQ